MRNNKKDCKLVCDLLPNYIENLTSIETNDFIESHLSYCVNCKEEFENYNGEFKISNREEKEIDYLKKYKRKIISSIFLGIGLGILLLFLSYIIIIFYRFFTLNTLLSTFNNAKEKNNFYLEKNVTTYQNQKFDTDTCVKYWYKDGILKIETSSIKTNHSFIYFMDMNASIEYIFDTTNKTVNKIQDENSTYSKENLLYTLLQTYYYKDLSSLFKASFDLYGTSIMQNKENIILNHTRIYDKSTGFICSDYDSDYLGNATITTYQYSFDTVTTDNLQMPNLLDYRFIS